MAKVSRIHKDKAPVRIHYIVEWAEHRGFRQADIVDALGVNKSTVSKWFSGVLPSEENLLKVAAFLEVEPNRLFRDPHDDWIAEFMRGRREEEKKRIVDTLVTAFPRPKTG